MGAGGLGKDSFVGRKVGEALLEHGTLSDRRLVVTSCPGIVGMSVRRQRLLEEERRMLDKKVERKGHKHTFA